MVTTTYPATSKSRHRLRRCTTAGSPGPDPGDPLAAARDSLRTASRLPFAASQPSAWLSRFTHQVDAARNAIRDYVVSENRQDSAICQIERDQPRLHPAVEQQRTEHAELVRHAKRLWDEAHGTPRVDIWRMIDLGEKAMLLEMALARHQDRLVRLVYESTNRELGGEAG